MHITAIAMPTTIATGRPVDTSANIGYGDAIASAAAAVRKRPVPMRCANQPDASCVPSWMNATTNRQSRISARSSPSVCVV